VTRRPLHRAAAVSTTLILAAGGVLAASIPASAATTFHVTQSSGDVTVAGTLAWAIEQANLTVGADTIVFDVTGTVTIGAELPEITDSLTIDGPGSGVLLIQESGVFDEGLWAFSTCGSGLAITLEGFSISGFGWGIDIECADLSLTDVIVSDSRNVGLVASEGTTTVRSSHIDGNAGFGGIFYANTGQSIDIQGSTFDDNTNGGVQLAVEGDATALIAGVSASRSAGLAEGFDLLAFNTATITVSGSTAVDNGDSGFTVDANDDSSIVLDAVTVTGNANQGLEGGTTGPNGGTITVRSSTFDDNDQGGVALGINGGALSIAGTSASGNRGSGAVITSEASTVDISGSTFDDNDVSSASVGGGGAFTLSEGSALTVSGSSFSGNAALAGGGIFFSADDSTAIMHDLTVDGNVTGAGSAGGGIAVVTLDGPTTSLVLSDSRVTGNTSELGGGILLAAIGVSTTTLGVTISTTTVDGNTATVDGGGIAVGVLNDAVASGDPAVTVDRSTLSNNTSAGRGGGLFASLGTLAGASNALLVTGSTLAGNTADTGGAAYVESDGSAASAVDLLHSTVAGNSATTTGGIHAVTADVTLTLGHTIVADNTGDDLFVDQSTLVASWSLVESPSNAARTVLSGATGVLLDADPRLGALADNGGATRTMLPATASPAVNAGDPAIASAPATDQRGLTRLAGRIDIGAVEVQPRLAAAGADAPLPLAAGALLLLGGIAVLLVRRRLHA